VPLSLRAIPPLPRSREGNERPLRFAQTATGETWEGGQVGRP